MTNEDIITLCKYDLGDEVVISKIEQASAVEFQLDVDDIIELKDKGVSQKVIAAMLKKTAPAANAPASNAGQEKDARKAGFEDMVFIKGGCFNMGDVFGDGEKDERPVHRICIDDFHLDRYEVTQKKFKKVMGVNPSHYKDCPSCPVEQVTWFQADKYCERAGKRLPTEAEWEYAAREGGRDVKYGSGGLEINRSLANYNADGTKPVGSYPPNALGLYDMAGNVWEWVLDWYGYRYYQNSASENPKGPEQGKQRVLRGGSWGYIRSWNLRATLRNKANPDEHGKIYGFRCAR